jgi:DNA-3-methyladenine glycosylase II
LVGDIELGETYLASLGNPWNLLIEQFRPCQLTKKDHLHPHQSVIKSIFFQQLTPHVGNIIFNRFKELFGGHFPPDEDLLEASEHLKDIGLSQRKIETIIRISECSLNKTIPGEEEIKTLSNQMIIERFIQIKGVGQWTVEMMLMFNQLRMDVMPTSDYALRKNYTQLFQFDKLITATELGKATQHLSPYRSIAAWYLWQIK